MRKRLEVVSSDSHSRLEGCTLCENSPYNIVILGTLGTFKIGRSSHMRLIEISKETQTTLLSVVGILEYYSES